MSLPIPAAARAPLKDGLFCISLGSLCFIRRWFDLEILQVPGLDFYRSKPRDSRLLIATLLASLALALGFWILGQLVRRAGEPRLKAFARCVTLLVMTFAVESMRRYWNSEIGLIDWSSNGILIAIEFTLAVGARMAIMGNQRILRAGRTVVLLAGFLLPAMLIDFFWGHSRVERSAFLPRTGLPVLPPRRAAGKSPAPRVVWLLFDEFDQHLAFDGRPLGLELPELDRLRAESLVANRVLQTATATVVAVPSLLSGQAFERTQFMDARTLLVQPPGAIEMSPWREQPNVFGQARRLGANTSLIGWQLPYCRLIGDSLVHCFERPGGHPPGALLREMQASEHDVGDTVEFLFYMQMENLLDMLRPQEEAVSPDVRDAFVQERQLRQFLAIRQTAYREISDLQMDFVFVHFPTPHLFAIYDRRRSDFALRPDINYLDNLALVDRTVGEIRRNLEQAGLWESTTLMVTSDHALRPAMWHNRYNWTQQFERLIGPGASRTVPFILKLAGQHEETVYEPSVSNVDATQLSLAALSGEVTTPQQAIVWLKRQSARQLVSAR
jgi:hypothetical protein